jgi:hypothetical protein
MGQLIGPVDLGWREDLDDVARIEAHAEVQIGPISDFPDDRRDSCRRRHRRRPYIGAAHQEHGKQSGQRDSLRHAPIV